MAGLLTLGLSIACPVILQVRRDAWNEQTIESGCEHLTPLPSAALFGGVQVILALISVVALTVYIRRSHSWATVIVAGVLVAALLTSAYGAMIILDAPTDPHDGVDGSGLPCGSG
ncbi:hypothetical protein QSJ19_20895 [Gordonia sp. ABSL11-1]|uniref:hypothetical protein n=1 Tax=Gordonia sp. ABSL11-1 TaxID=3053924 RepID=UPI0025731847|nr:hypothetical protein [Gordonia sp. ABSL11-1]MDL9947996.1 hypothetical protein [Gordonia sp. ABSL11-1]